MGPRNPPHAPRVPQHLLTPGSPEPVPPSALPLPCAAPERLTDAHVLVVQLGRAIAVIAQTAVLAVLASRVVFAADAGHHV